MKGEYDHIMTTYLVMVIMKLTNELEIHLQSCFDYNAAAVDIKRMFVPQS